MKPGDVIVSNAKYSSIIPPSRRRIGLILETIQQDDGLNFYKILWSDTNVSTMQKYFVHDTCELIS